MLSFDIYFQLILMSVNKSSMQAFSALSLNCSSRLLTSKDRYDRSTLHQMDLSTILVLCHKNMASRSDNKMMHFSRLTRLCPHCEKTITPANYLQVMKCFGLVNEI